MPALKGRDIDAYLKSPDKNRPIALLYGPDWGLVKERAAEIEKTVLKGNDDPFARIVLTSDDVATDPKRLADEANTISMFGGLRSILVNVVSNRSIIGGVDPLLSAPPQDAFVIFCAGDLKPSSPLRKRIEASKSAVSIPCYLDQKQSLNQLIDEEAKIAEIAVSPDARSFLLQNLGADRLASRNEIKKLMLYCKGFESVTIDHVREICSDVSEADKAMDIIDLSLCGDREAADLAFQDYLDQGLQSQALLSALQRHLYQLLDIHGAAKQGGSLDQAIDRARPPIFFRRKGVISRQMMRWSPERIELMLNHVRTSLIAARKDGKVSDLHVARLIGTIARATK